tara:strand:- start:25 stop:795 length:771 start_codon:yes stop_codon:yes gene_type:complete
MSKQIIIESKNGTYNIEKSRQATNESNLVEDLQKWQQILYLKDENIDKDLKPIIKSLRNRLIKNLQFHGLNSEEDITFSHIKSLAKDYLACPKSIQISLCRDSTRQGVDEIVQYETLKKYINNDKEVINLSSGSLTLRNGKIDNISSGIGEARSIDVKIQPYDYSFTAYGFLKYSKDSGSIQTQQMTEAVMFAEQAKIYCNQNKDNVIFFIQLDGIEGEKHIASLKETCLSHKNKIIVGNTEDIIDHFNCINIINN